MIKTVSSLFAFTALSIPFSMPASALTAAEIKQCQVMGASLKVRKQEAQSDIKTRAALFESVELAGDKWEAAEALREFGDAQANEADTLKRTYETLKSDLVRMDMDLSSRVTMINNDNAAYVAMCDS